MRRGLMLVVGLCLGWQAQAQILSPLTQQSSLVSSPPSKGGAGAIPLPLASGDTLALPFFDDFSKGEGEPDPARWVNRGGVAVTNRYAKNAPTIFSATFDGLKADGQSYGGTNAVGPTDTLISKPLYLGKLAPKDSLYLSFFWQAGGFLDAPNFSSGTLYSLQLEFKQANGTWATVWTQKGNGRSTDFAAVMQAIKEPAYFFDGFQFRWVSSGSQGGLRDVWHLDYVQLNQSRRNGDLSNLDVALTQQMPSLLRRYTAMPIWQFLVNPAGETRTELGSTIRNLSALPAAISWRGLTKNLTTQAVDTFLKASAPINANATLAIQGAPSASFLSSQSLPYSLQTTLFLTTKEPNRLTLYNDTLRRETHLQDFYAYDDGTAEAGFSFPSSNAVQIAYQFELNKPDRIDAVRIYFTGNNSPGTVLSLRLWRDANGKPAEQSFYEQTFTVPAASGLNQWLEIALTQQQQVNGRFYVGYRQPNGSTFVNVGYDLNENAEGKIFFTNGTSVWEGLTNFTGALLIRPVVSGTVTSSLEEEELLSKSWVYPNPSAGQLTFAQNFERVEIYSLTGQKLQTLHQVKQGQPVRVQHLTNGVYLLKGYSKDKVKTTKLILQL
ncbi:T9SS type A sorting domain-containing protein [Nibribacter koreensis]|uniref:Secretion system C-terminal sorting domain-containing protein n=1 Tax=Nibribacter koreensis TaxID=1084519 RepID=A0ABP8FDP3_9BACT